LGEGLIRRPEQTHFLPERRVFDALMARGIGWVSLGRVNDDSLPFECVFRVSGDETWFWEKAFPDP
jgi:hypothetical protein